MSEFNFAPRAVGIVCQAIAVGAAQGDLCLPA